MMELCQGISIFLFYIFVLGQEFVGVEIVFQVQFQNVLVFIFLIQVEVEVEFVLGSDEKFLELNISFVDGILLKFDLNGIDDLIKQFVLNDFVGFLEYSIQEFE